MKKYMQPATSVVEVRLEGFVATSPEIMNGVGDEADYTGRRHGNGWSSELWSGDGED